MMTGKELLDAWLDAKQNGITRREFAKSIGISFRQLKKRLEEARLRKEFDPSFESPNHCVISQDKNEMIVETNSTRIKTLQQALEEFKVDLDVWFVSEYKINKWEVAAKQDGVLVVEPLFQIKADLKRKVRFPSSVVIQPVRITSCASKQPTRRRSNTQKIIVVPDMHIGFTRNLKTGELNPFHDRLAISAALQVTQDFHPDTIVFLGDMLDLAEWTDKFVRSPEFYNTTQPAIIELSWWLSQFRNACKNARIIALEGNHEARLSTMINVHLSSAYQLHPSSVEIPVMSINNLCDLERLGIEYIGGYPSAFWIDGIRFEHGVNVSQQPGDTAKRVVLRSSENVVFGHTHRIERATRSMWIGEKQKAITALSPGCLCRLDCVVPGHKRGQNWQQAFTKIHTGNLPQFEIIGIENGKCLHCGNIYTGIDVVKTLAKDTGWNF